MTRAILVLAVLLCCGCVSTPAPPPTPPPVSGRFDDVRRVVIVGSGESDLVVADDRLEPGRTFEEILKWHPYGGALREVARIAHRIINSLRNADQTVSVARNVDGISPSETVTRAMGRTLRAAGGFAEVRVVQREPTGDDRPPEGTALVRVTVPSWGVTRVRQDDADLVSAFADVRAQMVVAGTGVLLWSETQDVTHPETAPAATFARDRAFAREAMTKVLERAGERLANEMIYARGAAR